MASASASLPSSSSSSLQDDQFVVKQTGVNEIRRRTVDVDGVKTDLLEYQPFPELSHGRTILICPGNPGVAQFYISFIKHLYNLTQATILCISLAGQDIGVLNGDKVYNVEDQINHKAALVYKLHAQGHKHIFIAAHSIGSYFCFMAMKRHPKLPVERLICLFPFMRYDLSAAQHLWHRALFLLSPLAVGTIGALRFVPSRLIQAVIHAATAGEYGSEALPTIAQMLHPAVAKNCFSLGEDEFNTVPKEFDYQAIAALGKQGKIAFLYTRKDIWATEQQCTDLQKMLPGTVPVVMSKDQCTHAFCVFEEESVVVARYVRELMDGVGHARSKL